MLQKSTEFLEYCVQMNNYKEPIVKKTDMINFSILNPIMFPKTHNDFLRKGTLTREFKHLMQALSLVFDFETLCIKTQTIKALALKEDFEKKTEKIREYGFEVVFVNE